MPRLLHLMAGTNHVLPAAELLTSRGWSFVAKGLERDREKLVVEVLARKWIGKLEVHILVGVVCRWGLDGWVRVGQELHGLYPADGLVQFGGEIGTVWSLEQFALWLVGQRLDLDSVAAKINQEMRQPRGSIYRGHSVTRVCSAQNEISAGDRSIHHYGTVVLDGSEPSIQWCPACGQDLVLKETGVNGLWYRWYRCPGCDWSVNFAVRYQKEGES